jgi:hypothetical protein
MIDFKGKEIQLKVKDLEINTFEVGVHPKYYEYEIKDWMALNTRDYPIYKNTERYIQRVELLEHKLNSHIIAFSKGVECQWKGRIDAYITDIQRAKPIKFKDTQVIGFSMTFKSNFLLPDFVGLGKGVSLGFGVVKAIR